MLKAGQQLRVARELLGLKIRDVEVASLKIAARHGNDDFAISIGRLSDIENKEVVPNIYRLHTLTVVYRLDLRDLLSWYGIDLRLTAADLELANPPRSHKIETLGLVPSVNVPLRIDPSFDSKLTLNLGRVIEEWGALPLAYLSKFANTEYTYGYVGSEDFTMYPILLPGSFVQVDERKTEVETRMWRSEYERPIYFIETRNGYLCSWCTIKSDKIILQPHPLSPGALQIMKHPQDAEVIGQVVGMAMRLGEWNPSPNEPASKAPATLN